MSTMGRLCELPMYQPRTAFSLLPSKMSNFCMATPSHVVSSSSISSAGGVRLRLITPKSTLTQGDWDTRPGFVAKGARQRHSLTHRPLPRVISSQNRMRMAQSPCRARHLPPPGSLASRSRAGPHRPTTVLHFLPMKLVSFFFAYFWFSIACGGREM